MGSSASVPGTVETSPTGISSLGDAFRAMVRTGPANVAVRDGNRELTYRELDLASDRIAASLRANGAVKGQLVGVVIDRSTHTPAALLGVLKAGCAYVPLDPAYPERRLRHVVQDCGLEIVVSGAQAVQGCGLDALRVIDPAAGDDAGEPPAVEIGADDPAYVIYTSGSTGQPKGCVVSHGNVLALMHSTLPLFDLSAADRWTLFHSAAFDFSVWELWGALLTGATAVCVPVETARAPEEFLELLRRERVTVLSQVPSAFRALCRISGENDPDLSLRYVVFGGESLDLDVAGEFVRRTAPQAPVLVNMYGITETTVHSTIKFLTEEDLDGKGVASIGVPLPHVAITLRDRAMRPVRVGETGEMYIAGAGVAQGYLNRPELTAERFLTLDTQDAPQRFYRTGDLGRMTASGELEYLGRNDQQVKVRGFRIEPGEIETALREHPAVRDAAVIAHESDRGTLVLAHVVHRDAEPGRPAEAVLRRHLAERLPAHMVPRRFVFLPELPLTLSGKLDRAALRSLAGPSGNGRR
ncbi:amino acid adenylation domain-containing protein [Streptomyces sp. NPDC008343]|uniref:amino acid adenylation domain-containing protein n=1 Tax=Streptomyces sp. NPDC008343 TaxID=3364828 RepID=UPI0036EB386C